jgi:hypothetical protein
MALADASFTACRSRILLVAGYAGLALALFQGVVSLSPEWSLYWGATPELVARPTQLLVAGEIFAAIFAAFGLYGLSGAGVIGRLPLLRTGLVFVGCVFVLRGLFFFPQTAASLGIRGFGREWRMPLHMVGASAVSLAFGVAYLAGTIRSWGALSGSAK